MYFHISTFVYIKNDVPSRSITARHASAVASSPYFDNDNELLTICKYRDELKLSLFYIQDVECINPDC